MVALTISYYWACLLSWKLKQDKHSLSDLLHLPLVDALSAPNRKAAATHL